MKSGIGLLGIPFDEHSSFRRGPALAPPLIRRALHCDASNSWSESGIDVLAGNQLWDAGDAKVPGGDSAFTAIEYAVGEVMDRGVKPLLLGGDHATTYGILLAIRKRHEKLTIVHFDAHPDLYEEFQGDRYSHACPFARIMEERLADHLIQIGIRTSNGHQREQAKRFGVEQIDMCKLPPGLLLKFGTPVYISLDLDVLDPAFAPGVSHREPGGLSTRQMIDMLHSLDGDMVGADLVEYNPACDSDGMTATVAAKLVKELAGVLV